MRFKRLIAISQTALPTLRCYKPCTINMHVPARSHVVSGIIPQQVIMRHVQLAFFKKQVVPLF